MEDEEFLELLDSFPRVRAPTAVMGARAAPSSPIRRAIAAPPACTSAAAAAFWGTVSTALGQCMSSNDALIVLASLQQVHDSMLQSMNLEDLEEVAAGVVQVCDSTSTACN